MAGDDWGDDAAHHRADGAPVHGDQRTQPARGRARATFLAAYLTVWTGFALVALGGDTGVHALVDHWSWLHARERLVLAGALAVAGLVQFSPLTQRCLTLCRDPRAFLYQHYRRGTGGAWTVGFLRRSVLPRPAAGA